MELIKQNTGYGLRALIVLAGRDGSDPVTADELADAADTSVDFMHKIMQSLGAAEIVESKPGPKGGFRLAREPEEIDLLEIVTSVQGPFQVNRCVIGMEVCDRANECPLRPTWVRMQQELENGLRRTTLRDITEAACGAEDG